MLLEFLLNFVIIFVLMIIVVRITNKMAHTRYMRCIEDLQKRNLNYRSLLEFQDDHLRQDVQEIMSLNESIDRLVQQREDAFRNIEMLVEKIPNGT